MKMADLQQRLVYVAGMSRAGTTYLYHNLNLHPDVFVPVRKEVCFFGHHNDKGEAWFLSHYEEMEPGQTGFDICGLYFMDDDALDRILAFNPQAKVILGVRDPVDWVFSMYEQYRGKFVVPPFREFVQGCTVRREGYDLALKFDPGRLEQVVEGYRQRLGDNLLLYHFPVLADDALALLQAIEVFADLPGHFTTENFIDQRVNAWNRQKNGLVDRALQLPGVANTLRRVVPRQLLFAARKLLEVRSSAGGQDKQHVQAQSQHDPADVAYVEERYAADRAYVERLFADGPIRRGGG